MAEARPSAVARIALPALAAVVVGTTVAVLPSAGTQLTALGVALVGVAGAVFALARTTPNAVWVIVLAVLAVDPLGYVATQLGLPVSVVLVIAGLPLPFAALALRQDRTALRRATRLAPLLALVALAGLSLAWSPEVDDGLRKLTLWILLGIVPAAAILILASPTRPPAWRILLLAAGAFAVALLVFGSTTTYPGRLAFEGGNPIWAARAAYIGALIALFVPGNRLVRAVLLVPLVAAGLLTDSLGPTLGLVLGIGAGAFESIRLAPARAGRTWLRLAALGLLVAIGAAAALAAVADEPEQLTPLFLDPNIASRASYLAAAADMFLSAPILGAGFGAFSSLGLADTYPHNLVAEIGAELGIVGLALLGAWLLSAFRAAAGSPVLVALLVATAVYSLFSGNVSGNVELWMVSALAVALGGRRQVADVGVDAGAAGATLATTTPDNGRSAPDAPAGNVA